MHWLKLSTALAAATTALALLVATGLPQRAAFTDTSQTTLGWVAPEPWAMAPPFRAQRLDDTPINLSELRGQTVVLNFWATWCGPCEAEMPELQTIHESASDVRVLAVNLAEPQAQVRRWIRERNLSFDIVLDSSGEIAALYRLRGQPTTFIIDPNGIISRVFYGPVTADVLQTHLTSPEPG